MSTGPGATGPGPGGWLPDPAALAAVLAATYPGALVSPPSLHRLSAGASRLTLAVTATVDGAPTDLVLQIDTDGPGTTGRQPASEGAGAVGVEVQASILERLATTAVPVPPLLLADGGALLGAPMLLTAAVGGETVPRRIIRDPDLAGSRRGFASACGRILATLHATEPEGLGLRRSDAMAGLRAALDWSEEPRPVFEVAYAWLDAHRPAGRPDVLVHGDFRIGNLIVDPTGIKAVLDWELAHLGHPLEDIGWLCSPAWRFGAPLPVGGIGRREDLYAAYEAAGGGRVDPEAARWWEVLASLRWGAICMRQARRHLHRVSRSVELATIGRRVCETEWDLLRALDLVDDPAAATETGPAERPPAEPGAPRRDDGVPHQAPDPTGGQHGRPTASELVEAVREFLTERLAPVVAEEDRFHLRVASNALSMVERQLELGAAQEAAHRRRLGELGFADDAAMARAIRGGTVAPASRRGVEAAMVAGVRDRLAVANPRHPTR